MVFDPEAARALFLYEWPLNVRELDKAIERAVALSVDGCIGTDQLPATLQVVPRPARAAEPLDEEDMRWRDLVSEALERHGGNVSAVARDLDKDRKQIHRWIRRFQIDLSRFRGA
jgi:transcriptional regulator of acetoin/glycerol metabolism